LLTGWNQDEGLLMGKPKNALAYKEDIAKQFSVHSEKLLKYYPGRNDEDAALSQKNMSRDMTFGMQNFVWSNMAVENGSTVFVYRFKRLVPENKAGSQFSAFHTGEVPYAYNNLKFVHRPFDQADFRLANTMSTYWINFIKTGNPNGNELPIWNTYTRQGKSIMLFDKETKPSQLEDGAALENLQFAATKNN